MTLQEAKEIVAKNNGFKNWQDWRNQCYELTGHATPPEGFIEEAALLYAESKWNQACGEQRNAWQKKMPIAHLKAGQMSSMQFIEYLKGQDKPPFKP